MAKSGFRRHAAKVSLFAAPVLAVGLAFSGCSASDDVEVTPHAQSDSRDVREAAREPKETAAIDAFHQELRDAGYSFNEEQQAALDEAAPKSCSLAAFMHAPDHILKRICPTICAPTTIWRSGRI